MGEVIARTEGETSRGADPVLCLGGGYAYQDLFSDRGLARLDDDFLFYLEGHDAALRLGLRDWRRGRGGLSGQALGAMLLPVARHLEAFVARLFAITPAVDLLREQTASHGVVMAFKKEFVQRRARRHQGGGARSFADLQAWLSEEVHKAGLPSADREWAIARLGMDWLADEARFPAELDLLTQWCAWALTDPDARRSVVDWSSFRLPERLDPARLVPLDRVPWEGVGEAHGVPEAQGRRRDGFSLTDTRMEARAVQNEAHYCLYCHDHDGDFCSKGFPEKKGAAVGTFKSDAFGTLLTGCPLGEKISEMQLLKRDGFGVAALAMIMVDNPMIPATGHRICNDCMKACVYQK